MVKEEYQFEDFIVNVNDEYKEFVNQIHNLLSQDGYKTKVESKATGFFVSYSHPKTKKNILNFLFRKKGLLIRIYADNCNNYTEVLENLPEIIVSQIDKAGVCKRLINPASCNPKCVMGYDFYIRGKHYQKCRNSCFYLDVNAESIPDLIKIIENENNQRRM